ncbi:MAG: cytochrome c family protein, partial [Calditrichaceae bacterium]
MNKIFITATLILVLLVAMNLSAQDKPMYVGVAKCKACHGKMTGDQYGIWEKGPHANALKSLSSEEAMKYAKENNIADPAKAQECLKCHATIKAVDQKLIDPKGKLTLEEGVSCESCHGPGSEYKSPRIMSRKKYKEDPAAAQKAAIEAGLIMPTEKLCVTCHN